jgi:hypothetical protein
MFAEDVEGYMDISRCPKCKKRLMALKIENERTELRCLNCDRNEPMKTDAAKWAGSSLADPPKADRPAP